MRKGNYAANAFEENLRAFARQRTALVKTLSSLAPADWSRSAAFTGTKPGWTQTVLAVARGLAMHEHAHLEQIAAAAQAARAQSSHDKP